MMKKISIMMCVVLAVFTSCNDYININDNPNRPVEIRPELVLPQALAATALVLNNYNTYGAQIGGYAANAGGFGGFNENVSYAYTPNNYANLWSSTYDNLEDYQYIINATKDREEDLYFYGVAKIMKVYGFQLLVDTYNDVPYSEALQGENDLSPAYDNGATIYSNIAVELDEAIAAIRQGASSTEVRDIENYDIIFEGDMESWIRLANTIKLRLIIRGGDKVTFSNKDFDAAGFLTQDALINPGYARDNNRQNPQWNVYGYSYTGTAGNKAWIPSTYILTFYDGTKLDDPGRGSHTYYQFPATGTNQLGNEGTGIAPSPDGSFWYVSSNRTGTAAGDGTGVMKGPTAGFPMFTAAESYFLQAEAALKSVAIPVSETAKQLFEEGITASFRYIYQLEDGTFEDDYETDAADYIADNANRLVQFDLATTTEQKLEAIITQKYIALNMVNSHEGWNEYRRTGYPKVTGTGATETFASTVSQNNARPDRLPSRILYPASEIQYNSANVPTNVNSFTSLVFWAK